MNRGKLYFGWNENVTYAAFLILAFAALIYGRDCLIVLFWFLALMLFYGNVRRVYWKRLKALARGIRRAAFLVPLYGVLVYGFHGKMTAAVLPYAAAGVLFGLCVNLAHWRTWRLGFSREVITMAPEEGYSQYVTGLLYMVGTTVGEEIFFRNFMIGYAGVPRFMVIAGAAAFTAAHVGNKWGESFGPGDAALQFVFALFAGTLFLLSGSVWPGIAAHLACNAPYLYVEAKKIYYKKKRMFGGPADCAR